jgi:hypothetical protein
LPAVNPEGTAGKDFERDSLDINGNQIHRTPDPPFPSIQTPALQAENRPGRGVMA